MDQEFRDGFYRRFTPTAPEEMRSWASIEKRLPVVGAFLAFSDGLLDATLTNLKFRVEELVGLLGLPEATRTAARVEIKQIFSELINKSMDNLDRELREILGSEAS